MKKKDRYWEDYYIKYKKFWHFNQFKETKKDYQYIGNIKANFKKINQQISSIEKKN